MLRRRLRLLWGGSSTAATPTVSRTPFGHGTPPTNTNTGTTHAQRFLEPRTTTNSAANSAAVARRWTQPAAPAFHPHAAGATPPAPAAASPAAVAPAVHYVAPAPPTITNSAPAGFVAPPALAASDAPSNVSILALNEASRQARAEFQQAIVELKGRQDAQEQAQTDMSAALTQQIFSPTCSFSRSKMGRAL